MSSLLEIILDDIIVSILSDWIDDIHQVITFDNALCNKSLRDRYCTAKKAFSKVTLKTTNGSFQNCIEWKMKRNYNLLNVKLHINTTVPFRPSHWQAVCEATNLTIFKDGTIPRKNVNPHYVFNEFLTIDIPYVISLLFRVDHLSFFGDIRFYVWKYYDNEDGSIITFPLQSLKLKSNYSSLQDLVKLLQWIGKHCIHLTEIDIANCPILQCRNILKSLQSGQWNNIRCLSYEVNYADSSVAQVSPPRYYTVGQEDVIHQDISTFLALVPVPTLSINTLRFQYIHESDISDRNMIHFPDILDICKTIKVCGEKLTSLCLILSDDMQLIMPTPFITTSDFWNSLIAPHWKFMEHLDLHAPIIDDMVLSLICSTCQCIRTFSLTHTSITNTTLPLISKYFSTTLMSLTLSDCEHIDNDGIDMFCKLYTNTSMLHSLHITSSHIDNAGYFQLLDTFKSLCNIAFQKKWIITEDFHFRNSRERLRFLDRDFYFQERNPQSIVVDENHPVQDNILQLMSLFFRLIEYNVQNNFCIVQLTVRSIELLIDNLSLPPWITWTELLPFYSNIHRIFATLPTLTVEESDNSSSLQRVYFPRLTKLHIEGFLFHEEFFVTLLNHCPRLSQGVFKGYHLPRQWMVQLVMENKPFDTTKVQCQNIPMMRGENVNRENFFLVVYLRNCDFTWENIRNTLGKDVPRISLGKDYYLNDHPYDCLYADTDYSDNDGGNGNGSYDEYESESDENI